MGQHHSKRKLKWSGAPTFQCDDGLRCSALKNLTSEGRHEHLNAITAVLKKLTGYQMCIVMTIDETLGKVIAESGWPTDGNSQLPRPMSFCAWSLVPVHPEVLVVNDARKDARFRQNPVVRGKPYIRFYAGAPLLDDNDYRLGSLCCIDTVARQIDAETCSLMCNFADIIVDKCKNKKSLNTATSGLALLRVDQKDWPIQYCDEKFSELLGIQSDQLLWHTYSVPGQQQSRQAFLENHTSHGNEFQLNIVKQSGSGKEVFLVRFRPAWKPFSKRRKVSLTRCEDPNPVLNKLYFATICHAKHNSAGTSGANCQLLAKGALQCPISGLHLEEALACGSFGAVHRGIYRGGEVAVKIVPLNQQCDTASEAAIAMQMHHPNVVKTHEYAVGEDNFGWIIMELCLEGTLRGAIDCGMFRTTNSFFDGTADLVQVFEVAHQIALGMKCMHDSGIIHGDLNCNNVLLSDTKEAKIADFGMSRALVPSILTETFGTMTHMPRELLVDGIMSQAVDVYSFGVMLWEMLTSQRAWAGARQALILKDKMQEVKLVWPAELPDAARDISDRCMSEDPAQRPSFDKILKDLEVDQSRLCRKISSLKAQDFPVYAAAAAVLEAN